MNLEETIAAWFGDRDYTWRLNDGREIQPSPEDVRKALDKAASILYDGRPGDTIEIAGISLLVVKTDTGFRAYALAGTYR